MARRIVVAAALIGVLAAPLPAASQLIEESGPDDSDGQPLRAYLAMVKAAR